MNAITSYAHIKHNTVTVNGTVVFKSASSVSIHEFLLESYKFLAMNYPKFHKMDVQCKLAIIATEFALRETALLTENDLAKIAIVFSNHASSLDTDKVYQNSISDKSNYFPSPAIFVYTLPNITIGELAIRHKITGENAFFVCEKFDPALLINYCESLYLNGIDAVIAGWVEAETNNDEAFIFLSESQRNTNKNAIFKPLNQTTLTELYNLT